MTFTLLSGTGFLVCAAYFLAGLVDAVCGGGGLISIPVLMMAGVPVHSIMGTNQNAMTPGSVVSFLKFRQSGYLNWPSALIASPSALVGAFIGARLNLLLPENVLRIILIVLVPVIACIVLFNKHFGDENGTHTLSRRRIAASSLAIGFVVGMYQGFYGAGSGTFFLLAFALLLKMDLVTASGTTKFVLMAALLTGAVTYIFSGAVLWSIVIPAAVFNIAGSYAGAVIAVRGGTKIIRPMFGVILVLLVVKIIGDMLR